MNFNIDLPCADYVFVATFENYTNLKKLAVIYISLDLISNTEKVEHIDKINCINCRKLGPYMVTEKTQRIEKIAKLAINKMPNM